MKIITVTTSTRTRLPAELLVAMELVALVRQAPLGTPLLAHPTLLVPRVPQAFLRTSDSVKVREHKLRLAV